jgi:ABC-2 type transport system ATP-binding protein
MIQVSNLSKSFGLVRALDDVSFSIGRGEIVGFLGPNGAGKTTAMRIIAGYLTPGAGQVTVDGVDITEDPIAVKARIGYLPEQPPVYPEMYVRDYLAFVAGIKGVAKAEIAAHVDEAMEAVQIADKAKRVIRNLSKGYKQRVGLAGALVHKPAILILDEPTVGLDPHQIVEIRKLIGTLKAADRTLIISTHILAEVEQTCEKVIIINKGRIAAIDSKDNLLRGGSGQQRLTIEVARDPDGAAARLAAIEGLSIAQRDDRRFIVTMPLGNELREQVARGLVEGGMGLLSMAVEQLALEDIFIRLTREEPVEKSGGAA